MEKVTNRKKEITLRLKRIEGQVRGLQRMVDAAAPCADILTQVAAVTGAMKRVGRTVVRTHLEECLESSRKEPGIREPKAMKDLQKAISRYIDWA